MEKVSIINPKDEVDPALKEEKENQLKELKKKHRESRKKRFLIQANEQKYKKIKFFGKCIAKKIN